MHFNDEDLPVLNKVVQAGDETIIRSTLLSHLIMNLCEKTEFEGNTADSHELQAQVQPATTIFKPGGYQLRGISANDNTAAKSQSEEALDDLLQKIIDEQMEPLVSQLQRRLHRELHELLRKRLNVP